MKHIFRKDFLILKNPSIYNHMKTKTSYHRSLGLKEILKFFRKSWKDSALIIPKK